MNISATTANQLIIEKNIAEPVATYHEKKVGKNLYRVTSLYQGKLDLAHALEDLIVNKILISEFSPSAKTACGGPASSGFTNENMDLPHKN